MVNVLWLSTYDNTCFFSSGRFFVQVGDARGTDPPQRLLNRHLPHVLTDVLMRGRSAWTDDRSSPGLQFLLK